MKNGIKPCNPMSASITPINQAPKRIIREAERLAKTGIPKTSWDRGVRKGLYPKPFRIGPVGTRAVGWLESDIDALIDRLYTSAE